jgi:hypothetical protein
MVSGSVDLSALKSAFETANTYAGWGTIAVIVGVSIEFAALFIFSKEMPPLEKAVMVFATFVIAAGCGGEWWYGKAAASDAAQIQTAENTATATAQAAANAAQLADDKLKSLVIWRTVTPTQNKILVTELAKLRGSVTIGWIANDPESLYFAGQIFNVFAEINSHAPGSWKITGDPASYSTTLLWGVDIPDQNNSTTGLVWQAFSAAKIPFSVQAVPTPVLNINNALTATGVPVTTDVFIMVGSKRPPL